MSGNANGGNTNGNDATGELGMKSLKEHNIPLATSEIASLWAGYLANTMANRVLKYFLHAVEDAEIQPILAFALSLTEEHIAFAEELFADERFPIPKGFTDEDVDVDAPRLFSDKFMLLYLRQMGVAGASAYATANSSAARKDIRDFFTRNSETTLQLLNRSTDVLESKGVFVRPPQIQYPDAVEFVKKEGWLNGLVGDRRPVHAAEITHIWLNIFTNTIGKSLMTGFAQTTRSEQLRRYFVRGKKLAGEFVGTLSGILEDDELPASMTYDAEVTDSTTPPFSDKLMLFHTVGLGGLGIGNSGLAAASSTRRDIAATYLKLLTEAGSYADDGAELLIANGWLEKMPGALERDALANV